MPPTGGIPLSGAINMVMNYTSLLADKGQPGSIATWVGYKKLDLPTILDEAQSLLYSMLRVRQMRTEWTFGMSAGQSEIALPDRFLDPMGPILAIGLNQKIVHRPQNEIERHRMYDNTLSGALDDDPITTTANSSLATVRITAHGLTQGSSITIDGLAAVGGLTLNGTYPVASITNSNTLVIDAGTPATSAASGGGDDATYTANLLIASIPQLFSVWDEAIKFDYAFETAQTCKLLYYRSPALLSSSNQTNWLTARYPRLLRTACQAAAADFMKDTEEYTKAVGALQSLIQSTAAEDDLMYRGSDIMTETP